LIGKNQKNRREFAHIYFHQTDSAAGLEPAYKMFLPEAVSDSYKVLKIFLMDEIE